MNEEPQRPNPPQSGFLMKLVYLSLPKKMLRLTSIQQFIDYADDFWGLVETYLKHGEVAVYCPTLSDEVVGVGETIEDATISASMNWENYLSLSVFQNSMYDLINEINALSHTNEQRYQYFDLGAAHKIDDLGTVINIDVYIINKREDSSGKLTPRGI